MAKLISIFWRDIPAQVVGRAGRGQKARQELDGRFQRAIDRAAMRAGRGASDAYLEDWRRVTEATDDDLQSAVSDKVRELEARFPDDYLEAVVKNGGLEEGVKGD